MTFHSRILDIDPAAEANFIIEALRHNIRNTMRRYGAVVGISGGVDSSVVLALCVAAFGPERVIAVMMPEKDSDPVSERLARQAASRHGVTPILENITPALEGFGCYQRRDEAIRRVAPEFNATNGYTVKIALPTNLLDEEILNVFSVTVVAPTGKETTRLLPRRELLEIVAASNFKQRTRMSILYYHAERNNHAVVGTTNKTEYDQGFFVKHGDEGVDVQPLIHLYKTQVYQLAQYLCVPEEIRERPPTTDTYSARSTQQEFFFRLPFETMDLLWFAHEKDIPIQEVTQAMGLTEVKVHRAHRDFARKHRTTNYLRMAPLHFEAPGEHRNSGAGDLEKEMAMKSQKK